MSRYDRLLADQSAAMESALARVLRRTTRLHEQYRRDVVALLTDYGTDGGDIARGDLPALLPRLRMVASDYARRMTAELGGFGAARDLAATQALDVIAALEPPPVVDACRAVLGAVEPDDGTAALWVSRYWRESADRTEGAVLSGVLAAQPRSWIIRRTAGASPMGGRESAIRAFQARARLVAHMEYVRAASESASESIRRFRKATARLEGFAEDPVWRAIHEIIDRRNHPISRVLNRMVADSRDEFRAPESEVFIHARLLGKGVGGIVWPMRGSEYVGKHLPAHYADRGRIVPFRESWRR